LWRIDQSDALLGGRDAQIKQPGRPPSPLLVAILGIDNTFLMMLKTVVQLAFGKS
jgi:hypothetical protein